MARRHRTRRKQYKPWGRNANFELAVSILVVVVLIATAAIFLFVFHDFPFRTS